MRLRPSALLFLMALCAMAPAAPARADRAAYGGGDRAIQAASLCAQHFPRVERQYGLPKQLLMAISATESGRWHKGSGLPLPWPWTINVEGKGYYFDSMHDAVTATRRFQQKGYKSIDVGCMQINLRHHPKAFASLTQAFTPEKNVAYAARFLRENFAEARSWRKAVAAYHSKTPARGSKYFALVQKNWRRVLTLLQASGKGYVKTAGDDGMATLAALTRETASARSQPAKSTFRAPRMKVIQVSSAKRTDARHSEILIVRPAKDAGADVSPVNVVVANASAPEREGFVALRSPTAPTIIRAVAKTAPVDADGRISSRRKGPNFVFN